MTLIARALLAAYGAVLACISFSPTPVDRPVSGQLHRAIDSVRGAGATAVTYDRVEVISNLALYIPLGALIMLAIPRLRWWAALPSCAAVSVTVEAAQLLLIPERFGSITDITANTSGALVGIAIAELVRIARRRSRAAGADEASG